MAGLLARGSLPCAAFPVAQWRDWRAARRLTLPGSHGIGLHPLAGTASPCSLLIPEGNHPGENAESGFARQWQLRDCIVTLEPLASRALLWQVVRCGIEQSNSTASENFHENRSD